MTERNFSLTTKRAAEIAGVPQYILLSAFKRHGHYLGVAPRKQANGRHLWPATALYLALGRLPKDLPTPASRARDHVCQHTGADPLAAQQVLQHLFSGEPIGATPADRFAYLHARIDHLIEHLEGVGRLAGATMADEGLLSRDDIRRLHWAADRIEVAAGRPVRPLRWLAVPGACAVAPAVAGGAQ